MLRQSTRIRPLPAVLAALCLIAPLSTNAQVVINELHINPDIKTELVEFVEIYNAGTSPVDLGGWYFSDGIDYAFPSNTIINSDSYLIIAQNPQAISNKFSKECHGQYFGSLDNEGERIRLTDSTGTHMDQVEYRLGFPWPIVGDSPGLSMQLLHPLVDNDLGGNWRSGTPSPKTQNVTHTATNNIPPRIRQVDHDPKEPISDETVLITAKVTDPDGVANVTLHYQLVDPGNYINTNDAAYQTSWTDLAMNDTGTNGDEIPGDDVFSVTMPLSIQTHRRLVRYRITAVDTLANSVRVPYTDDPQPNFAYFVYDGVPAWTGSDQPGVTTNVVYGTNVMRSLPVYHLIVKTNDLWRCTWPTAAQQYWGMDYPWCGTLIYDGDVYDHVSFRARGGVWRYAMGKNMWKFDFKRGHYFKARDNRDNRYDTDWDKLNLSACIQQGDYLHRGEHGMFEAVGFRLFELAGVPASKTHWIQFRVIDAASETGSTQYDTDFWGLYLAIEQVDGRFLNERDLPDGNLYKMEGGTGELNNQGPTGAADKSDLNTFMSQYVTTPSETWWRQNVDVDCYYSYRTIVEGIHHYDIGSGKNYFYYLNPVPVINGYGTNCLWSQWPWDLDLTWADNMWDCLNQGLSPFKQYGLLNQPILSIEHKNRIREVRDLLFNANQAWQLIDDYAAIIDEPAGGPSILDADRAMWDYHPIMTNEIYVNLAKAGHGRFYQRAVTKDFRGMLQIMKDYVTYRSAGVLDPASADPDIPGTPAIWFIDSTNFAIDSIELGCSSFSDPQGNGTFGGMKWRVGEITDTNSPAYSADIRKKHEIETIWECELSHYTNTMSVPAASLRVGHTYRARVRMKDNTGRWSHWSSPCVFTPTERGNSVALLDHLRVTELMFNPAGNNNDLEFIELYNTGTDLTLDLYGVALTGGIDFIFTNGTTMAPESYLLVVRDEIIDNFAEFRTHYNLPADTPITGPYDGRLSDDGEQVNLRTALSGTRIVEFEFNDGRGWPIAADDAGHSLVPLVLDAQPDGALDYGGNWRASAYIGGSPGRPDPEPPIAVVINEIMAHTDYTNAAKPEYDSNDWLELYNPTASPVSLQNWYLSDEDANLRKWAIPGTNTIPANGWITFDEITGFHTPITNGFGINKSGEQLFLSYLPGTAEDRVADAVIFRGQENDISLGRWSDGATYWYALTPTTNAANAPPDLHVVITEIVYNPLTTQAFPDDNTNDEYIRIHNPLDTAVALWNEIDAFRIEGAVSYSFPSNTSIPAGGTLTLVSFNPADPSSANLFVEAYGPTNGITILGPYSGKLSNRGERITLEKPQPPDAPGESVSWITIDEVIYFDQSPWPDNTDGTGSALQRISNLVSGNDPSNWKAGPVHIPHILHWKLDDNTGTTALDSSPHANNGTLLDLNAGNADGNTPPVWTDGKYAYALEFDGADDVVRFGGQNVQDYPFTVMAWIKTASGAGTPCAVFVGDGTDAAKYYSIGVSDGKPEIVIRAVARNRYSAVGATDVADNQWHHLAAVFHDQTNRTLYVNAAYETGLPMDFPFLSTVNRVSAGLCDRSTSWDCPWSGRIDDVRIYNRALSTNEIREMMFRPAVGPDNPDEDSDGLPDAWELLYFSATNAPGATPDAHADSDGVCNLDEYIAGTDPTNSASAFAIHITLSNGAVIVTLPTVETAGAGYAGLDRYYDLESSDNLCVGTWLPVPGCSHIRGDDSILSHTNPPAASKFFRATTALE